MTVDRHELYDLVEELPDDQVAPAIADLRRRLTRSEVERPWPPKFFGAGVAKDDRTDIASNIDTYLAEGFGQTRS